MTDFLADTNVWLRSSEPSLGRTPAEADLELQQLEETITVLPDNSAVYSHWRQIVQTVGVLGASVYDARLIAAMKSHGLNHILTFNVADFQRYSHLNIIPVHPIDI